MEKRKKRLMEILGLPYWEDVSLTKFKEALLIFFF